MFSLKLLLLFCCFSGSEFDEEDVSENEDSDDSWTNQEEFSSDLILRLVKRFCSFNSMITLGLSCQVQCIFSHIVSN